jgi:hypothetical protein
MACACSKGASPMTTKTFEVENASVACGCWCEEKVEERKKKVQEPRRDLSRAGVTRGNLKSCELRPKVDMWRRAAKYVL